MTLSQQLVRVFEEAGDDFSIGELLDKIDAKSFGFILTISPLPTALPFTPPGFTLPFGFVQCVLAGQMVLGKRTPWIPGWILRKKVISGGKATKMWSAMPKFLAKFEKMIRPRSEYLTKGVWERLLGVAVFFASLAMMVPFPVTNSICALGVFLVGLAMVEEDGLMAMVGLAVCFLSFLVVLACILAPFFLGRHILTMESWW